MAVNSEAVKLIVFSLDDVYSDWRELFLHDAVNVHTDESPLASLLAPSLHKMRVLKTRTPSSAWCSLFTTDCQACAAAAAAAAAAVLPSSPLSSH